jgi:hypothetical protein
MYATVDPEVKRYRATGAALRATILLGVVAGLAVVGARSPDRPQDALLCAHDPAATGTMNDAMPGVCGTAGADSPSPGAVHRVPEAAAVLDPNAPIEAQPPTF